MSTFTEDVQRRLRAVLALRSAAPIPSDAVIEIETDYFGSTEDTGGLDLAVKIRTADFRAAYRYDEPGAWARLLADLEAVDAPRPLNPEEGSLLIRLSDLGGQVLPDNDGSVSVLAERGLIDRHGDHWYITPAGREAAAEATADRVRRVLKAGAPKTPPFAFVRVEKIGSVARSSASQWWAWDELGTRYRLDFAHGIGVVRVAQEPRGHWPEVRRFEQGTSSHITLDAFAGYAGIDVSQIPEEQRS